jgi:hypothetical protein
MRCWRWRFWPSPARIQGPDVSPAPLAELDAALAELKLSVSAHPGRSLVARVAGLLRLVRWLGGLVALQTCLALLAVWLR